MIAAMKSPVEDTKLCAALVNRLVFQESLACI